MLRTLEIGHRSYIKIVRPADTVFVSTSYDRVPEESGGGTLNFSLTHLPKVWSMLAGGEFDAIVVHAPTHLPTSLAGLSRIFFGRHVTKGHLPLIRSAGTLVPPFARLSAPMALVDFEDHPFLFRHSVPLLKASRIAFKRELPADRWRMLSWQGSSKHPSSRFRKRSSTGPHLAKLRPLPLGIKLDSVPDPVALRLEKTSDIFFAGLVDGNSTVRSTGLAEVLALRDAGFTVDVPESRLPPAAFLERCARAWLVWSPEGIGWDCFRHYETPLTGSVPLINTPSIERHEPLRDGVHAIFYDTAPGGLTEAFRRAIADKDRLRAMARDGRAHVLKHHTPAAIADYILTGTVNAKP